MKDTAVVFNFRVSNHNLAVERDRYEEFRGVKGKCRKCDLGEAGDEYHVFVCPFYRTWQIKIARALDKLQINGYEQKTNIDKIESDFNNGLENIERMKELMYGDTGIIRCAFNALPGVFIHLKKNSGFHLEWTTGIASKIVIIKFI